MLKIIVLGGFRVEFDGQIVDEGSWRLSKARTLVKLLALADDHQLHREQVMDILWPEMEPTAANNNFHQVLFAARRALATVIVGDTAVTVLRLQNQILALDPTIPCWVDAEAFQQAVADALRSTEPADSYAAVQLYGGELLPEDRYEDWAIERRNVLRARYLDCLMRLAGLLEMRGEAEAATDVLRQVLSIDPVHEDAHIRLMQVYALTGRRRQAMRQFDHLCEALERELDAEPSDAAGSLYAAIQAGDFGVDRPPIAGLASIPAAGGSAVRPVCRKRATRRRGDRGRSAREDHKVSSDGTTKRSGNAVAQAA
jgi:DNA-binding SARP family transcriptional activator